MRPEPKRKGTQIKRDEYQSRREEKRKDRKKNEK
jgi:hypothetical protein